ncbi:hypothetical protein ZTR_03784 [Talaromyces verruculosus]|nr:hypothetical protein ZTR_03784 [Talaromyces verruculosus]
MSSSKFTPNGWIDHIVSSSAGDRKTYPHDHLHFDPKLRPKPYKVAGTSPDWKALFLDVNIIDSTGREPYRGDVLVLGERIAAVGTVPNVENLKEEAGVRVIHGGGRTLMSGLGDAHAHLTWNDNALELLGEVGVEEHTLITARSALSYIDSGYTMCYGAASAKNRLDCVIRDEINSGRLPGPRMLANAMEIAKRGAELASGITAFADGPLEMREMIRHHAKLGVDQVKLSMSGEAIMESRSAEESFFEDEETAACVDEAHRLGLRVCSHARARDAVLQCVRYGVDVIYHGSYIDDEGMDMLEKAKHKHVVAPAINWLYTTVHEAEPFGYTLQQAEKVGYKKELEVAIRALREMRRRGITILPGGDYGFAWCPHGTYARDLEHFVKLLGFTPMESIVAATAGVAKLFMQEHELGKILPGYYADCILVDDEFGKSRIGHLDFNTNEISPLTMSSGYPLRNLYQVIELGEEDVVRGEGPAASLSSVKVLPPLPDRDVLCIGVNYRKHATEYRDSGYSRNNDESEVPLPVVFSKRSTSIIAANEEIFPHPTFTQTIDYEGEVGVIIGKTGFNISADRAMEHVWGYTIINDVTAREKQRDHHQFFIGKSAATFCPMVSRTLAVPAAALPPTLRIQTFVNGEKRQDGTTADLIASIPRLIEVLSSGMTLQPGDVIATGTPHGVGVGFHPPKFLQPGDVVEVAVAGLGKLSNQVALPSSKNPQLNKTLEKTNIPIHNLDRTLGGISLTQINLNNFVNVRELGKTNTKKDPIVFIHGLGASLEYYRPLIQAAGLEESGHRIILYDLEGHGLTPTRASHTATLKTYAMDLELLLSAKGVNSATLVGWSLGGLIAMYFAQTHPSMISKLVLLGPGGSPLPEQAVKMFKQRAAVVREQGMEASGVAQSVATGATSALTKATRPLAIAAVRQFLVSTHPEGYAKGCMALAKSPETVISVEVLRMPTLIVVGRDDSISPLAVAENYLRRLPNGRLEVLDGVGHWHVLEDLEVTAKVIKTFLAQSDDSVL